MCYLRFKQIAPSPARAEKWKGGVVLAAAGHSDVGVGQRLENGSWDRSCDWSIRLGHQTLDPGSGWRVDTWLPAVERRLEGAAAEESNFRLGQRLAVGGGSG